MQTVGSLGLPWTMGRDALSRAQRTSRRFWGRQGRDRRQAGSSPHPRDKALTTGLFNCGLGCVGVKVRGCQHPEVNIPLGLPWLCSHDLVPWHPHCSHGPHQQISSKALMV